MAITPTAGYMVDPNNPNGVVRIDTYVPPAPQTPAPAAAATPSSLGLSSYVPKISADQQAYYDAQKSEVDRLAADAAPESESDRRTRITSQFQSEIDALNAIYAQKKQEAIKVGLGRLGTDSAIQNRRGLIGSSFGTQQTAGVQGENDADLAAVDAAKAAALNSVYSKIQAAISKSEDDKKAAQSTSAAANLAYLKSIPERKAAIASDAIKALLAAKASPSDKDLQDMAAQIGIDPATFKQQFISAAQAKVGELQGQLRDEQKFQGDQAYQQSQINKNNIDSTAPKAVGDQTWIYENGAWVNKGLNKVIQANTDGMTTRQNIVFNQLMNQAGVIDKTQNTFKVISDTSARLKADPANAQLQLSMLYQYVKALDSNSAVREGETQLAKDTASFYEKAQMYSQKLQSGSTIGSDVALKMADEAQKLASSWTAATNDQKNLLQAQARGNGIENQFTDALDYAASLNGGTTSNTGGVLRSPDGTQEVDISELSPEQVKEAKAAGWQ